MTKTVLQYIYSMPKKQPLDLNPQFKTALNLLNNTKQNVFITGRAGTGKSTLLRYFLDNGQSKKKAVVLAPTGVAAINVGGQTVHSFFGFKPDITLSKVKKIDRDIYKKLEMIIIDEISMVRADLLDCVDKFLRLNRNEKRLPFGGVQMIFIGDLYQLPPVVTGQEKKIFSTYYNSPYFFSAHVFGKQQKLLSAENDFKMEMIELEKIYRQKDNKFIDLLNSIRNNSAGPTEIDRINKNLQPNFIPTDKELFIYLTPTNIKASQINNEKLARVKGKEHIFIGEIKGKFDNKYLPTEVELKVKIGAQIMLLNNDSSGNWVNGTIARITDIDYGEAGIEVIEACKQNGELIYITPHTWEIFNYSFNTRTKEIEIDTAGSFTQYPFKLAWAVTIHKSQGKTFEQVILDIDRGTFSPGQLYVALSRCVSLEGLILKKPIAKKHVWLDWRVVKFVTSFQCQRSDEALSLDDKIKLIKQAIKDKKVLDIIYLKFQDIKSVRQIKPRLVGEMEYLDKKFIGVSGFCLKRKEERVFRVDRILEIKVV